MEREDFRRRTLIVPMNLRESATVEATRSMAAVSFGAFVPVGKIGSGALHVNCLVKPVRVFPLGSFAFFCLRARRVASSLNLQPAKIAQPGERRIFCLRFQRGRNPCSNLKDLRQSRFMGRSTILTPRMRTMNLFGSCHRYGVPPSGGPDRLKPGLQTGGSWKASGRGGTLDRRKLNAL